MDLRLFLIISGAFLPTFTDAMYCDKVFNYYEKYGNGFDVTCSSITKSTILENITVSNEITLTIDNSTLTNITAKIFHNLDQIRQLVISNSTLNFRSSEAIFEKFALLESLSILNTKFALHKFTFRGLENLKALIFKNNSLAIFDHDIFELLPKLEILKITQNHFKLDHLKVCNLKVLHLAGNNFGAIEDNAFVCRAQAQKILDFDLNRKKLNLNLEGGYLNKARVSSLEELNLSHNNLTNLNYCLYDLTNLKKLNLNYNKLEKITFAMFSSLNQIETINLANNSINFIAHDAFDDKQNLLLLNLNNNRLGELILNNRKLQTLFLSDNKLNAASLAKFKELRALAQLNLNNNAIEKFPANFFASTPNLKYLAVSGNRIQLESNSFDGLINVVDLDLSRNNMKLLANNLFKNTLELQSLDLSFNELTKIENDIFSSLINLEALNMSFNLLENLEFSVIAPLKNLQVLDLAGNKLHVLQYDLMFSKLPSLFVINIKHNLLTCSYLLEMIEFLRRKGISYTITDEPELENINVEGIYCKTGANVNETRSSNYVRESKGVSVLTAFVIVILIATILGVIFYKVWMHFKRRRFWRNEFELIG